jgi:phage terminase large subunit
VTEKERFLTSEVQRWAKDARVFVRENFGITPDKWQDKALRLISKPETQRLALKACKGPGKTAVLAWIILWFLATRWQSKVGCTSITEGNIDTNLWPEISKWMERSPFLKLGFVWTTTKIIRKGDPNWFAVKRTWPKSGDANEQANALAGLHADHVMFVLDESGGIPQAVMVTAEAVLAGLGEAKVVQSGNPTHTSGPLHRACTRDRALWEVITITGDPDDPNRSPRIPVKWARELITSYGRDNPWVLVNVFGEFPPSSINALLGVEDVEKAMHRRLDPQVWQWSQKRIGVDVARFGDDRTVLFPRQGRMSWMPTILRNQKTTQISARVATMANEQKTELIFIDETFQWGKGVLDQLGDAGYPCVGVDYSENATNPRFKNVRCEMWWTGAEFIKGGASLPLLPDLIPEFTEITYTLTPQGQFLLEPKELLKARIGLSPDIADAYMQTFVMPEMPGQLMQQISGRTTAKRDADPYNIPRDTHHDVGRAEMDFDPYAR